MRPLPAQAARKLDNPVYHDLHDPPTPSGRLVDRIHRLRVKCIEGLGKDAFRQAYQALQEFEEVLDILATYPYVYAFLITIYMLLYKLYNSV